MNRIVHTPVSDHTCPIQAARKTIASYGVSIQERYELQFNDINLAVA